jgi:hypothetical protein
MPESPEEFENVHRPAEPTARHARKDAFLKGKDGCAPLDTNDPAEGDLGLRSRPTRDGADAKAAAGTEEKKIAWPRRLCIQRGDLDDVCSQEGRSRL